MLTVLLLLAGQADPEKPLVLKGHTDWVGAVAFSRDGKLIATASADRTARLWDLAGKPLRTMKGHEATVSAVAFGPDGVLVTGSHDGTVRFWPLKGESRILSKQRGAVLTVAVSPDGRLVGVGGVDGMIRLIEATSGKVKRTPPRHETWVNSLAFSRSGATVVSGSSDGTVRLWREVLTGRAATPYKLADPREIRCAALSPDGWTIAAAVRYGSIVVWDEYSGKELATLKAHEGEAWTASFSPDGKTLASGGGDWGKPGTVKLWDTTTWKAKATLPHPAEVLSVAFSPDGARLAVAGMGRDVRVWRLDTKPRRP